MPTDVLPPLAWLQRSSIKGVLKWEGCSVKVTKKAERYFLSIPSYSSSELKTSDESGSLYDHLFVLLSKSKVFFARSLWHGCTADQIIEIAPYRCAFQSLSNVFVIDYGSVGAKRRCELDRYGVEVFGALPDAPIAARGFRPASPRTGCPFSLPFQPGCGPVREGADHVPVSA